MPKTSRNEQMQRILRRCALELDPSGQLAILAAELGIDPSAIRRWWLVGRVPKTKAEWLERRFPDIADSAWLSGADA